MGIPQNFGEDRCSLKMGRPLPAHFHKDSFHTSSNSSGLKDFPFQVTSAVVVAVVVGDGDDVFVEILLVASKDFLSLEDSFDQDFPHRAYLTSFPPYCACTAVAFDTGTLAQS